MGVRSSTKLDDLDTKNNQVHTLIQVSIDVAGFDEGVEGREEWLSDGLEVRVGERKGRFKVVNIGEK